jgi:basic membrane protein A
MTMFRKAVVGIAALTAVSLAAGPALAKTKPANANANVGLLFDITGRGDKSFNDSAAAGLDKIKAEYEVSATESAPTGDSDRPERLKTLIDQKVGMITCVGFLWQTDCGKAAKANPGTSFAIIDSTIEEPNAVSLVFAENEGSYLAGVIAAQASKTGKLGFIGGVRIPSIQKFEAGFVAGVKSIKPKAKIEIKYASEPPDFSGFNDAAKGQAIGKAMYSSGIDVVYHAAGGTGAGLFKAAKESGKKPGKIWAIGVDSDQYQTVAVDGGRDYILTSMLKRVDVASYEAMKAYLDGKPLSGLQTFDLKRSGVGYATSNKAVAKYAAKAEAARKKIIAGAITVPSTV